MKKVVTAVILILMTFSLSAAYQTDAESAPIVYFASSITPESLIEVCEALDWQPVEKTAVKLASGEPPASNYLRPELIGDLVRKLDADIVECNTAYGGKRMSALAHYQIMEDHGFADIAKIKILDEDGSMAIPVSGGSHLSENLVGAAFTDYDSYVILSHFKGHTMAGYGGAIKNMSIGLASKEGKKKIHNGGKGGNIYISCIIRHDRFLESMADAAKSVSDYLGDNIIYINVMNRLSVDCDCVGRPDEPDMHDIGILASLDPVALDQACIDLVYAAEDNESLVKRIESRNGLHTLEAAEEIKLGSRFYRLVIL